MQAIQNGFNNIVAAPVASKRHQLDTRRSLLSRAFSASGDVNTELSNGGIAGLREGGLETLDVCGWAALCTGHAHDGVRSPGACLHIPHPHVRHLNGDQDVD